MLVLSMNNNFEYLFTISRVANRSGRWAEHADYSILHSSKMTQINVKPSTSNNGPWVGALPESYMTQTSSQDVSSDHEEQLMMLVYYLTDCRPVGTASWTCRLFVFPLFETEKKQVTKTQKTQHFCFFLVLYFCDAMCVCVSICSEHIPSTLGANRNVSTRIWLLWGVFFIFTGAFGTSIARKDPI